MHHIRISTNNVFSAMLNRNTDKSIRSRARTFLSQLFNRTKQDNSNKHLLLGYKEINTSSRPNGGVEGFTQIVFYVPFQSQGVLNTTWSNMTSLVVTG